MSQIVFGFAHYTKDSISPAKYNIAPQSNAGIARTSSTSHLVPRLVADKRNDHAVEVEEEHDEVEAELEEGFLFLISLVLFFTPLFKLFKLRNVPSCARSTCGRSP